MTTPPTTRVTSPDATRVARRALPWIARFAWLAVALGGAALEGAVEERSEPIRWLVALGGWTVWGTVLVALLIPSTLSLTWVRVVGPLSLVAVVGSIIGGAEAVDVALLAVPALVAVGACFTPEVGRWMVQASAYGDEDRLPLRTPVPAGTAAVVLWFAWAASVVIGPLALAAGNLAAGIPLVVVALAASVYVGPRWYRMAKRWLVLVPAGLVVHDPVVLADTLMVRTSQLAAIGLARSDTEAADLTGPASGFAVEVLTSETVSTVFAYTPKDPNGRAIHMTGFLIAPSRPGEALRRAAERGLPVT